MFKVGDIVTYSDGNPPLSSYGIVIEITDEPPHCVGGKEFGLDSSNGPFVKVKWIKNFISRKFLLVPQIYYKDTRTNKKYTGPICKISDI